MTPLDQNTRDDLANARDALQRELEVIEQTIRAIRLLLGDDAQEELSTARPQRVDIRDENGDAVGVTEQRKRYIEAVLDRNAGQWLSAGDIHASLPANVRTRAVQGVYDALSALTREGRIRRAGQQGAYRYTALEG